MRKFLWLVLEDGTWSEFAKLFFFFFSLSLLMNAFKKKWIFLSHTFQMLVSVLPPPPPHASRNC